MNTMQVDTSHEPGLKETLQQIGVWGLLVFGFLAICAGIPMLALSI